MRSRVIHCHTAGDLSRLSSRIQSPLLLRPILVIFPSTPFERFSPTRDEARAIANVSAEVYVLGAELARTFRQLRGGVRLRFGKVSARVWWPENSHELSDQLDLSRPAASREVNRLIRLLSESERRVDALRAASVSPTAARREVRPVNASSDRCELRGRGLSVRPKARRTPRGRRRQGP